MSIRIPLAWLDAALSRMGITPYLILGDEYDTDVPGVSERKLVAVRLVFGSKARDDYRRVQRAKALTRGRFVAGEDL